MLLVLEQELAWGAAERSYCPEQSAETLTASLAFYLVEARVSIRGWERAGDGCCKPCLCGMKELPVKVAGKVPARVFTAEVKLWLFFFFFHAGTDLPLGYRPAQTFGCIFLLLEDYPENCRRQECCRRTTAIIRLEGELLFCVRALLSHYSLG